MFTDNCISLSASQNGLGSYNEVKLDEERTLANYGKNEISLAWVSAIVATK